MNSLAENFTNAECNAAGRRLRSLRGDPFLFADWERVLFLHFALPPEVLRSYITPALELESYDGTAIVSLVALTMRRFQPVRPFSFGWALRPISCQKFFNVRTYVRHGDEPGALFLWGWLSNPFPFPAFGLPCAAARMHYQHDHESGRLGGEVRAGARQFKYRATISPNFEPSARSSLAEFALERYTGFFAHRNRTKIFRAWHPAWPQTSADVNVEEDNLLAAKFRWFKEAKLIGANFAPGFRRVSLGRVHSLAEAREKGCKRRHGASAFYEMP
jgi:uncharacterized protein YqjF (DUF2071 family)